MTVTWCTGDALELMRSLPDASVDAVVCSPPFLALRDYSGLPGQWGSEATPALFLANLLALANETRRVLTRHGSIAWELGDTYSGSGGAGGDYGTGGLRESQLAFSGSAEKRRRAGIVDGGRPSRSGRSAGWPGVRRGSAQMSRGRNPKAGDDAVDSRPIKPAGTGWPLPKSLAMIPTLFPACLAYGANLLDPATSTERAEWIIRLAGLGMSARSAAWLADRLPPARQFDPWRVRNVIVWCRSNPPVGALGDKVRPATSYITVACTSGRRWFDLDAVRTPSVNPIGVGVRPTQARVNGADANDHRGTLGPFTAAMQAAGAPPLDHWWDEPDGDLVWLINTQGSSLAHYAMWPPKLAERLVLSMVPPEVCRTCGEPRRRLVAVEQVPHGRATTGVLGWSDCGHGDYRRGVVLDPFAGTGTTLAVADIHGRDAIGFDLDPANEALYPIRHRQVWKALGRTAPPPVTPAGRQVALW